MTNSRRIKKKESKKEDVQIIATNHQARRDYFIDDAFEAGLVLVGCEVKSLREAQANLAGCFARIDEGQAYLYNLYIAPYDKGGRENPDPRRRRKLLLHRSEIEKIWGKTRERGFALIPLKLYFKHGLAKIEIALAKGKKLWDKRSEIKKQAAKRDIDRALKNRNK